MACFMLRYFFSSFCLVLMELHRKSQSLCVLVLIIGKLALNLFIGKNRSRERTWRSWIWSLFRNAICWKPSQIQSTFGSYVLLWGKKGGKLSPTRNRRALMLKKALSPLNWRKQTCGRDKGNPRHKGQSLLLLYLRIKYLCHLQSTCIALKQTANRGSLWFHAKWRVPSFSIYLFIYLRI